MPGLTTLSMTGVDHIRPVRGLCSVTIEELLRLVRLQVVVISQGLHAVNVVDRRAILEIGLG